MRYGTWLRLWATAWAREAWANVTTRPALLVPHFHSPRRCGPGDGYRCAWCGTRSARVQLKGQRQAERLRRELA
jgi:hypothetical protein